MKNRISKNAFFSLILLGLILILLLFFYQTILIGAGRYLAPEGMGKADVVILEGTELIKEKPIEIGMGLISSGKVSRIVVVVKQNSKNGKVFALPNYTLLLTQHLEGLGLKQDQFQVFDVPTNHPITLAEAKIVLSNLSKSGVSSAILLAEGFHTKGSRQIYEK